MLTLNFEKYIIKELINIYIKELVGINIVELLNATSLEEFAEILEKSPHVLVFYEYDELKKYYEDVVEYDLKRLFGEYSPEILEFNKVPERAILKKMELDKDLYKIQDDDGNVIWVAFLRGWLRWGKITQNNYN